MNHYETLGVQPNATPDEIKKAYRKLASTHHPDKGGSTATFQAIQAAYETLSDPAKRQQFDNPQPGPFPGGHFEFRAGHPFDGMFGDILRQHRAQQAQLYRTEVWVTLEQVLTGDEQTIQLQTPLSTHTVKVTVPKGVHDGSQVRLDNILGPGVVLMVIFRIRPHLLYARANQDLVCNHSISVLDLIVGSTFEFTTLANKTLEVTVPPRTQPNSQMKIAGHGLPYLNSGQIGDQIILLKPTIPDIIDEQIINSILQSRTK